MASTPNSPTPRELLELDIDLRLGVEACETVECIDQPPAVVWALLRYAYGRGYHDALTERRRGQLFRDHGLEIPRRERGRD